MYFLYCLVKRGSRGIKKKYYKIHAFFYACSSFYHKNKIQSNQLTEINPAQIAMRNSNFLYGKLILIFVNLLKMELK